jgi:hypothetical protein
MRLSRCLAAGLLGFCLVLPVRAGSPQTPQRLVPERADLVLEVPDPHRLVETIIHLDLPRRLEYFAGFREFLDSTPRRRALQLVAYIEKQLGAPWPQLLDRLAGNGALMALQFGPEPVPVLFVVQGTDERLTDKFFRLGLDVLEGELARQEGGDRLSRGEYHGLGTAHAGPQVWLGQAGAALLVANSEKVLHEALDRHLGRQKKSLVGNKLVEESRQLLPPGPLARVWVSLDAAHKNEEAKKTYTVPRDDPGSTVSIGTYLDLVGRSPYVCAGLYPEDRGALLTVRMPRGRDGMGNDSLLHLPPAGQVGSRPLLEPRGVLYSSSDYLDFARIWTDRTRLFNDKQVKSLEEFDKTTGKFLLGNRMSKLLTQLAPYYRFVATHQPRQTYKKKPETGIPAFALVAELRQPEKFGPTAEAILRGAAFLAGLKVKMKSFEEKRAGCKIVGWRFPEDAAQPGDEKNFRFNFSPCFACVGNQFVVSSTIELGRDLVDVLQEESRGKAGSSPRPDHSRVYAEGVAELLEAFRDRLLVQTVLDQAATPGEAREQVRAFIELVRGLGVLDLSSHYGAKEFHYDVRLTTGK